MKLVLGDVDRNALEEAARGLGPGVESLAVPTDVSRPEEVETLARRAFERFGGVRLLFNNAGVGLARTLADTTAADWRWLLGVNLWGVIHGVAAFLPRMEAQGWDCSIVNTASAAGFLSEPAMGAYSVSKHAVVVLSETLQRELAASGSRVGVTILCPAYFPTGIADSERVRPPELASRAEPSAASREAEERLARAVRSGRIGADEIAARALAAVEAGELYLFTHRKIRLGIEERMRRILEACPLPGG
jgi:NAD(P)-dependent dehydrogenase (short-subunit alcohol dehydrogenase family)